MASTTLQDLAQMKRDGHKSACIVAWDHPMAAIAERAGADLISVGDSVGINLWGHRNPLEVTMEEMIVVGRAVRRGAPDTLLSVDFPFGPLQQGPAEAVRAAIRLAKEVGADLVKLDGAAAFPEAVEAIVRAGIPVWAQFGITPQTALAYGVDYAAMATQGTVVPEAMSAQLVEEARRLEEAGAALLNFTNSGPVVGPAVVDAVSVPVLGGFGGGPWLDGRIRMAHAAIGYSASMLDAPQTAYANVAQTALEVFEELLSDVREGRQIKGGRS